METSIRLYLDFETRSKIDIWSSGGWVYAADPSTSILCAAHAIDNERVGLTTKDQILFRQLALLTDYARNPNVLFISHNAFFERAIWINIMVKQYGMPHIPITRWRCTAAKACSYGLPKSLEKSTDALGIANRKSKEGRQIMLRMCKPLREGTNLYDDTQASYEALYKYCIQDVEVERELDQTLPDLSSKEQEIWNYDQVINTRGVRVGIPTVHKFINILSAKTKQLNAELVSLTSGKVTKGTQVQSMLAFLNEEGAGMTSLDKQAVTEAIVAKRLTPKQIQILRLRQQLGKSSLAKYGKLISATAGDGVLRDCFTYHAASTGRWGGKLVQLQNLPRGKIDTDKAIKDILTIGYPGIEMVYPGKIMDVLSACIRGVFVPSAGKELYVVDYGAIEARVVMWLAGEDLGLREFKATDVGTDEDIYVKMAQRIHNNPTLTKKNNPGDRQLGKQAILGCGYGMGGKKFKIVCAGYNIIISEDEAQRIVTLYRSTYYHIRNYWYDMERTMLDAFNTPGTPQTIGAVRWIYQPKRDAMYCQLPSKRILTYLRPKMVENKFHNLGMSFKTEVMGQWVRRDVFGGLLVENVVQATARDLMAYSIPRLEKAGFPILMHNHDEIVSERLIGENKLQEMIALMCILPEWATGCPVVAEGFTGQRYKKG